MINSSSDGVAGLSVGAPSGPSLVVDGLAGGTDGAVGSTGITGVVRPARSFWLNSGDVGFGPTRMTTLLTLVLGSSVKQTVYILSLGRDGRGLSEVIGALCGS